MSNSNDMSFYKKLRKPLGIFVLLILALMLSVANTQAGGKGSGKGGGKGGDGGDSGGGPQTELHLKWRVLIEDSYSLVRPVLAADGTIYVVTVNGRLVAVDPDGKFQWEAFDAGAKGIDVGLDGTIYTGDNNHIKAFYPDGRLKWTFVPEVRPYALHDVAVGPDGNVYGVASASLGVFSLEDLGTYAELRWSNFETFGKFLGYIEATFGTADDGEDQIYFSVNGHSRAVRLSDGASIFQVEGAPRGTSPQVSLFDDSWHRGGSAYTPAGDLMWAFEFPLATGFTDPSLAPDGTHYTVNSGNTLYAIGPLGNEEQHRELNEFVGEPDVDPTESLVIMPTNGTATYPPALKAVSTANGGDLWRMEFPDDGSGLNQFVGSRITYSPNGDTAYIMTSMATTNRTYLNAVDTNPSIPNASTILRSTDIVMSARSRKGKVNFTATITIKDENLGSIGGATVSATWTLPDGSLVQQTATSSGSGQANFSVSSAGGLSRIDITDISKDGYIFDPQHGILHASWAKY